VAVLNIALCVVLAPPLAAVGVAAANCIALVSQNVLNQLALRRTLGTGFVSRESWGCYGLILVGAGVLWVFQVLVEPGIVASVGVAAVVSVVVLLGSRRALRLGQTFPELLRIPVLGRLLR
jgi:O-antigen/teichoic acid export membrane protein